MRLDEAALRRGDFVAFVDFASPFPLRPPIVGIIVSNEAGIPIWGTDGKFHRWPRTDFAVAEGTVRCEARGLPLAPSTYRVSIWLSDWHASYEEKPDAIAFDFRHDSHVAHRQPPQVIGNLDWKSTWQMVDDLNSGMAERCANEERKRHVDDAGSGR